MVNSPFALFPALRSMFVAYHINSRNFLHGPASRYSHPVENLMFDALSSPGIHVHWGVYMSGKSRAAMNAGLRLQTNRLVILLHGFDFHSYKNDMRVWLQHRIGVPEDEKNLTRFFDRPASVIIDHFDYIARSNPKTRDELLQALREMGVGVLLIVSSWERAIELRDAGCKLLGHAGCGRWTAEQLVELRDTLGKESDEETMRVSVLSGTPMYMMGSSEGKFGVSAKRAVIQDAEWRKGIQALEHGAVEGVVGTFPDKNMRYHWDMPVDEEKVC